MEPAVGLGACRCGAADAFTRANARIARPDSTATLVARALRRLGAQAPQGAALSTQQTLPPPDVRAEFLATAALETHPEKRRRPQGGSSSEAECTIRS